MQHKKDTVLSLKDSPDAQDMLSRNYWTLMDGLWVLLGYVVVEQVSEKTPISSLTRDQKLFSLVVMWETDLTISPVEPHFYEDIVLIDILEGKKLMLSSMKENLRLREEIPDGEAGDKLVAKGLAAIASMLRRAPDPEGEDGFMLNHLSLREHILTTETMSHHVEKSRKAFAKAAMSPDEEESISNYLYRTGVDHLLSNNQVDDARSKLLDLDYLGKMFYLGKQNLDILQYWLKIGDDDQGKGYIASVNEYMERELKEENLDILEEFLQLCAVSGWYPTALNFAKKITDIFKFIKGDERTKKKPNK